MNMFAWLRPAADEIKPDLSEMIRQGEARATELRTTMASLAVDAASGGAEGAQQPYRDAAAELATVTADLALLQSAQAEHAAREAVKLRQARAAAHREKVQAVKADLDASHKAAEQFEHHIAEAAKAYDALIAARGAALGHNVRMPDHADVRMVDVRRLVGHEMYRCGARLNDICANSAGLPAPEVQDIRWRSDPRLIQPLAERLRAADAWTLSRLEEATP
jgi:hypothetical protein